MENEVWVMLQRVQRVVKHVEINTVSLQLPLNITQSRGLADVQEDGRAGEPSL